MAFGKRLKPNESSFLQERRSHFFKVILPSTLEEEKLIIPPMFVRNFGHELTDIATFVVSNGHRWQVCLKKDKESAWFHHGWNDFRKFYSISAGYFLLFKYEKSSKFHVVIFDYTTCEINYLYKIEDESITEDCDQIGEELFNEMCSSRTRMNQHYVMLQENESDNEFNLRTILEEMKICITRKHRTFSAEESKRAVRIARFLKMKNPTFMVILQSSDITGHAVYVPAKFANQFWSRDTNSVEVQVYDESLWAFQVHWKNQGGFVIKLTYGWAELSKEKNLVEGDIFVFELIRRPMNDVFLKLSIFHA